MSLATKKCIPCEGGVPALGMSEIDNFMVDISHHWRLKTGESTKITRMFKLRNFAEAMKLATDIGAIAEREWHHPVLHVGYGYVKVDIWTTHIGGLTESDFIFAAKVDRLYAKQEIIIPLMT